MLKHYDNGNGYEFCSGRQGWPRRKTLARAEVTCKNCLKRLALADRKATPEQRVLLELDDDIGFCGEIEGSQLGT